MKRKNIANKVVAAMREAAAIASGDAEPAAVYKVQLSPDDVGAQTAITVKDHLMSGPKFDDFEIERDHDIGGVIEF